MMIDHPAAGRRSSHPVGAVTDAPVPVRDEERVTEIRQSHAELLAEADATEAAAQRFMVRLKHLSQAIEDLRMRVGSRELNRDVRDLYTAVPSIVCAKLSEGGSAKPAGI
jgi:hypothetical protein